MEYQHIGLCLGIEKGGHIRHLVYKFLPILYPFTGNIVVFGVAKGVIPPLQLCPLLLTWFNFNPSMDK